MDVSEYAASLEQIIKAGGLILQKSESGLSTITNPKVFYGEKFCVLTVTEYAICGYLMMHWSEYISYQEINEGVFGIQGVPDTSNVRTHALNLKKK
jgi:DNA-binding response OmpR family regulator